MIRNKSSYFRIHIVGRKNKNINMNLSPETFRRVEEDRDLRLKIAIALGVSEVAVKLVARKRSDVLTKYAAVKVLQTELCVSDPEELFEKAL